jgi:aryl-phospho-beta-D-glucosidase BglC (GH1 family)
MLRWILSTLALAASLLAQSTGVTDARYAHLARGVNMNNWFQPGTAVPVGASDVTLLKNSGFTCIRLPVAPEYLLANWASASTIAKNLTNLDAAIDLFVNAGMAVMLDFHADAAYVSYYWATPSAPQELVSTWQMLATRYSNRNPELLFFEVMNEPTNLWTQTAWDTEQLQVLAAIHKIAPQHTVLVTPTNWSNLEALMAMTPYSDPNVVYVWHDYYPLTFTHQGATWVTPTTIASLRNVPYPSYLPDLQTLIGQTTDSGIVSLLQAYQDSYWTADQINWNAQLVADWVQKWGVRVVVNEFGVYQPYSPPDSRARWLYDMQSALSKRGLGWAMWNYAANFSLVIGQPGSRIIDPNLAPALGIEPWTAIYPAPSGPPPAFTGMRSIQLGGAALGNLRAEGLLGVDLNGDGALDLVMAPINYPTLPDAPVQLFLNQGGGVMSPANFVGAPPTVQFVDVIVPGRFDRSGRLGVFLPDQGHGSTGGAGTQSKLILPAANNAFQDATANLPQQIAWTTGGSAADVNGDGVDDLAVFYNGSNRPPTQILLNDGTGRFQADSQALPSWVSGHGRTDNLFTCGVFVPRRGQSVSDLIAIGRSGTGGHLFRNDGTGKFSDGGTLPPPPAATSTPVTGGCAVAGDLNGDGNVDLVVAFQHAASNQPDFLQILINNGDGTFRDETSQRIGAQPVSQNGLRRISLVPANNGKSHALILNRPGEPPLLLIDRGDGVFRSTSAWNQSFSTFASAGYWVMAGGDFNGDGLLDLAFGEGGGGPSVQAVFGASVLPADGSAPSRPLHRPR